MQRLITFGCSITYGHGLPDCFQPPMDPGPAPSSNAWPNVVANNLNVILDNQSKCGNSNLAILYDILNYKFLPNDVVVIMWSFTGRDLIFGRKTLLRKQIINHVGLWQNTPLAKSWADTHPACDVATRTWLYVHHATLFLKSKNIKVYNVFAGYDEVKKYRPKFLDIEFVKLKMQVMHPADWALDNLHPGIKTHQLVGNEITEILKCK